MRMLPLISVSIYPGQTLCEKIVFRIQWFKDFTKTFPSIMRALDVIPRNVINCVHVLCTLQTLTPQNGQTH